MTISHIGRALMWVTQVSGYSGNAMNTTNDANLDLNLEK